MERRKLGSGFKGGKGKRENARNAVFSERRVAFDLRYLVISTAAAKT
jgi:hypothetical protein